MQSTIKMIKDGKQLTVNVDAGLTNLKLAIMVVNNHNFFNFGNNSDLYHTQEKKT